MKKLLILLASATLLHACKQKDAAGVGEFTLYGEVKNPAGSKVYLEQLYFDQQPPRVLDSATLSNGKFNLKGSGNEEGMYRLNFEGLRNGYLFINDAKNISFVADMNDSTVHGAKFSSPANQSFLQFIDKLNGIYKDYQLAQLGVLPSIDSTATWTHNEQVSYVIERKNKLVQSVLDTSKSAALSVFAFGNAQEMDTSSLTKISKKLKEKFPHHHGIKSVVTSYDNWLAQMQSPPPAPPQPTGKLGIGMPAPELTMNDVNGKPLSVSNFRGKYLLVDFWASWCGPCRRENPNVAAAFEKFKNKNFTILGVSLDEDAGAWKAAIAKDKLNWPQMSDLKGWGTKATSIYGFDAIPFNVLLDPQGNVIATDLRGSDLHSKLSEVLK